MQMLLPEWDYPLPKCNHFTVNMMHDESLKLSLNAKAV